MYLNGEPLFSFGHGLSYTQFKYSNLKVTTPKIGTGEAVHLTVDIQNTGKRKGDEVMQLYIHSLAPGVKRAAKELRGFERISLSPGEKRTVKFMIPADKLAYYDVKAHGFTVEPGSFELMIGSSSEDIRLKDKVVIISKKK